MKTYILPSGLKKELRKIWGIPFFNGRGGITKKFKKFIQEKKFKKIITVGDYCSLLLPSDVKIFDGKVKRKKINPALCLKLSSKLNRRICKAFSLTPAKCGALSCRNLPGTIQREVWSVLKKAIENNENVFIDGEEDLLVIPLVLLSEKGAAVIYGFPDKGICLIEVSSKVKKDFKELLQKFKTK